MHRVLTNLAVVCLLSASLWALSDHATAAQVDVAAVDPEALFEALSDAPMSDAPLPGSLQAEDAEVAGYGDRSPIVGNVAINWFDEGVYLNYFVFETMQSAATSYAASTTGSIPLFGGTPEQDAVAAGLEDTCKPSMNGDSDWETCFTLRSNVIVVAYDAAEDDAAEALLRAAVEHLENVARAVAEVGVTDPGSSAEARSTAEAEVADSVGEGTASSVDPSTLVAVLAATEMTDVSLPGFLDSDDATVTPNADGDQAVSDAVGGVTVTWSDMDEGNSIGLVVFADEGAASAAYEAKEAAVEADRGNVPTFQTAEGLEGFCDFFSMDTPAESETQTCYLLSGTVLISGFSDARSGYAGALAGAGALHLEHVVRSVGAGDVTTVSSPEAEVSDPGGPEALVDALEVAEIGPSLTLPAYLPAADAEVNRIGDESLDADMAGGVTISWASSDAEQLADGLIYVYVYKTDEAAAAAFSGDDPEPGDEATPFNLDANIASGSVEGLCLPVDEDEDGVDDYDFCAAVSGNVFVVAADLTDANDGAALVVAAFEHVKAVQGS